MDSNSLSAKLLDLIQKKTLQAAISKNYQNLDTDALTMSIDMNYNRSNISRSLNNLNRGGFLVKVHGRPTYYLDKKTICDYYNLTQVPLELENLEQLKLLFVTEGRSIARIPVTAFRDLIGGSRNESLHPAIERAMKTALYPAPIHPYLITGPLGTGKQSFCSRIFQMEAELRPSDPADQGPLWIDLSRLGAEQALEALSQQGQPSAHSIGFLHADRADPALTAKLAAWCNSFSLEHPDSTLAYAILSEDAGFSAQLLQLLYPAPEEITLPPLTSRSLKEQILFVLSAFQQQCDLLRLPITLDRSSFQSFLIAEYAQNLRSLNNAVRQACQNSYYRSYPCSGSIQIMLSDIPDSVFDQTQNVPDILPAIQDIEEHIPLNFFSFSPQKSSTLYTQLWESAIDADGRLLNPASSLFQTPRCDTLYLQCEQDLRNSRRAYQAGQDSKTFQLLLRLLTPLLTKGGESSPPVALYYGLIYHLSEVVNQLLTNSYQPSFPPLESLLLSDASAGLSQAIQQQFDISLPLVEQQYLQLYLDSASENRHLARVKIVVLCHWSEIIQVYQRFAASLLYENQPKFFSYKKNSIGRERELQQRHILKGLSEFEEGGGLVIISDGTLDKDFIKLVYQEIGRSVLFITHLSQEIIRKALMFFDDPLATLGEFGQLLSRSDTSSFMVESRITMRIKDLINDTLVFLDTNKAYDALSQALSSLLEQLSLPYNDSLAIRFIVHTAFTLERAIRGEPLSYKKAEDYLRQNRGLTQILKHCLEPVQNRFNVQISNSELAYLVEILKDYTE